MTSPEKPFCFQIVDSKPVENGAFLPRSGHRVVVDESALYCWGGYNPNPTPQMFEELWKYNFWSQTWTKLDTHGDVPTEVASHSVIKLRQHLLHFGGTAIPFGETCTNSVYDLDLSTLEWKKLNLTTDDGHTSPRAIYGHTMTVVDGYVYVIAGTSGFEYDNFVHRLDLKRSKWEFIDAEPESEPSPRYRHEVVYYDRKLFMFGGGMGTSFFALSNIHVFDVDKQAWQVVETKPDDLSDYPPARRCHSCTRFRDDAYLCGGLHMEQILSDVWKFNLPTLQWTKLHTRLPQPVYFHSAGITPSGCLYVFGGVTQIDNVRTNVLQRLWLSIPTLKQLCWRSVARMIDTKKCLKDREPYLDIGIPPHFLDLL